MPNSEHKYFVYEIHKFNNKIRAIIWHVKIENGKAEFVSEYTVGTDILSWTSYCTCIGWQMRKDICSHLKALFEDNRYKEMCKNEVNKNQN